MSRLQIDAVSGSMSPQTTLGRIEAMPISPSVKGVVVLSAWRIQAVPREIAVDLRTAAGHFDQGRSWLGEGIRVE